MGRAGQTKCQSSGRLELLYKSDPNITTDGGHMEIILVQGSLPMFGNRFKSSYGCPVARLMYLPD